MDELCEMDKEVLGHIQGEAYKYPQPKPQCIQEPMSIPKTLARHNQLEYTFQQKCFKGDL